jgi:hypothetical protein
VPWASSRGAADRPCLLPRVFVGAGVRGRDHQTMDRDEEEGEKEADLRAEYAEEWAELCEAGWAGPRHEPTRRSIYG